MLVRRTTAASRDWWVDCLGADVHGAYGTCVVLPLDRRRRGLVLTSVRRALRGGREVVVKRCSHDGRTEAAGLAALAAAGARVPTVHEIGENVLVMDWVTGDGDWAGLGERLVVMHRAGGTGVPGDDPDRFGWDVDGWIGLAPMCNGRGAERDDWPTFFATHRVLPWVGDLPAPLAHRLRDAVDRGDLADVLAHDAAPSLVHGDLWSGNVVDGEWLIDPAVHRADRELDLAMADLFGGFPRPFWEAYTSAWPLDDGWRRRRRALQLFHLLVHVHLFGGGYVARVARRLDALGW